MKKLILLPILCLGILTACNTSTSAADVKPGKDFKEYTFTTLLEAKEKNEVLKNINMYLSDIISVEGTSKVEMESGFNKDVVQLEKTYTTNNDEAGRPEYNIVTNIKSSNTSGGITLETNKTLVSDTWVNNGYYIKYEREEGQEGTLSYIQTTSANEMPIPTLTDMPCYEKDGQYYFIESTLSKNVTQEKEGEVNKELVVFEEDQTIYIVNKDYQINNGYIYHRYSSNKDNNTGEWLSSIKEQAYSYTKYEYTYSKDVTDYKTISTSELNNEIKDIDVIFNLSVIENVYSYEENTFTLFEANNKVVNKQKDVNNNYVINFSSPLNYYTNYSYYSSNKRAAYSYVLRLFGVSNGSVYNEEVRLNFNSNTDSYTSILTDSLNLQYLTLNSNYYSSQTYYFNLNVNQNHVVNDLTYSRTPIN